MQSHTLRFIMTCYAAVLMSVNGFSQTVVKGLVKEYGGRPVPGATVLLYRDSLLRPPVSAYAITRSDGSFTVERKDSTAQWLQVKALGYDDALLKCNVNGEEMTVTLHESSVSLKEVLVKGSYSGVKVSGDTIKFDTDHFRTGTEDNMADVLKRLPGVEVSESGRVSYSGKPVDKLLIDGRDVLASNSEGTVVNNMSADMVAGAEILKNYKSGSLTDGFGQSDMTALNIKTGGKRRITGNADAGGGVKDKYNGKAAAMYLGDKSSVTAVMSGNNTGLPVFTMNDYLTYITGFDNLLSGRTKSISLSGPEADMVYTPENIEKQNNGLISLGANYKPGDSLSVRGNVLFYKSDSREAYEAEDVYFSDNSVHQRNYSDNRHTNLASGTAELTWKPQKNIEINSASKLNLHNFDNGNDIDNSGTKVRQDNDFRKISANETFNLNYKAGNGLIYFNAGINYSKDRSRYNLLTDNPLFPSPADSTGRTFCSRTNHQDLTVSPEAGYSLNFGSGYNINVSTAYSYDRRKTEYTVAGEMKDERITLNELSAGAFLRKKEGLFKFRLGSFFSVNKYRSTTSGLNGRQHFWQPAAEIEFSLSRMQSITASASRTIETAGTEELTALNMVKSYNSISESSAVTSPYIKTDKVSAGYNMFNIQSRTFVIAMLDVQRQTGKPRPVISQNGLLTTNYFDRGGKTYNTLAVLYLKQELKSLPVSLSLNTNYSRMTAENIVNSADNGTTSEQVMSRLDISTIRKRGLNGEVEATFKWLKNNVKGTDITSRMTEWKVKGTVSYATKTLRLKGYAAYRKADNPLTASHLCDLGFSAEYRIKSFGIKLSGENLLHLNKLEWTSVDTYDYFTSTTSYKKVGGNLLLGLTWRF